MDKLVINGGNPLSGSVTISGAKNAVLPLMAASLLVDGKTKLNRVPNLRDTSTMIRLLSIVGAETEFREQCLTSLKGEFIRSPVRVSENYAGFFLCNGTTFGPFWGSACFITGWVCMGS